jgi:DNA-binding XRE family transcriptional regulator
MTVDAEVGKSLHLVMWQRGITQEWLARELGVNQSTMSRKIKGRAPWTLAEVYIVARALDLNVRDLLPEGMPVTGGLRVPVTPFGNWLPTLAA